MTNIIRRTLELALVGWAAVPLAACGARSASPAMPQVIVQPSNDQRVLLAEEFDTYSPHWRQVRGQWALVGGNLLQARDDARELNTMMYFDPLTVADVDITVQVSVLNELPQHLTAGDDELLRTKRTIAGAGVVFRYQDQDNFYMFRTAGEEGVVLGKVTDGQWHELASPRAADFAGPRLKTDRPYDLRVRAIGNRIQAWIGDTAVANVQDSSLGTGRVGLATFRAKAAFTTLKVVEQ